MLKLDAIFVHANSAKAVYQSLANEHSAIEPPVWCGLLANHCRARGFNVAIIDCEAERLTAVECAERIQNLKPRITIFVVYGQQPSASSQTMEGAITYSEYIKNTIPEMPIAFVGAHVAALPLEVLNYKHIDFVCQNEGVYTISDLLSIDDLSDHLLLKNVKGLGWKDNGQLILNTINNVVPQERLEIDLPGVAWDLLPSFEKYRTAGWHSWPNKSIKSPFASLYTSLGCIYTCSFCMISIINRTRQGDSESGSTNALFRHWTPQFIIKQFDHFAEKNVINVKIADELFVLKEKHFLETCKLLQERKYNMNIWAYARIDICKPKWLEALKNAGVNFLGLGIESPDQIVRKDVIKGGYKEVKIESTIKEIQNAGIGAGCNYIVGLPKDTEASMRYNIDFAKTNLSENYNIYSAMAYPGSQLYLEAKKNNITLPDRYAGYSQHSYWTQNLPTETLTAAEVLKARDQAWYDYFSNPSYHNFLRSKYGQEAVDNVTSTLGTQLKRRLFGDQEPI